MNRFLFKMAAVAGMAVTVSAANAIQTFDVTVGPSGGTPASGTYHVILTAVTNSLWSVYVKGNADGNGVNAGSAKFVSAANEANAATALKHAVDNITIAFFSNAGATVVSGTGGTSNAAGEAGFNDYWYTNKADTGPQAVVAGPAHSSHDNKKINNQPIFGTFTPGTWIPPGGGGSDALFKSPNQSLPPGVANDVAQYGGNHFSGNILLDQPFGSGSINIRLADGGQDWALQINDIQLTPEASSVALLLPGLAPLGFLVYRRRRANKA